ncbi:ATP-dependent helicase [Antrihabitans cavernicola]|uniref:DNA 3'-5' helicase n=1 Tax=Antrihabitans cavernicola TaxID=2495913 RepID=A0A5A7SDN4_9NOCA|nr:ATP-dependent DNA helicase [Spelaeibacter cavernicola]KAA0024036.1 ATP-dependent helicase [Spelaeibacter cavernicola]
MGNGVRAATPSMRLVHRRRSAAPRRLWNADVRDLLIADGPVGGWAPWHVLGGPGTGKTAMLTDLAVERIVAGGDPESVLVLTQSRRAATDLREAITTGLLGAEGGHGPTATREPLVRTVHSYAFAVLRLQASTHGNPPPRLMTGAEQDSVLREMLRGDIEDCAQLWPERLRPALAMGGFAAELRDLMLRSSERGLGPEDLIRLGRRHSRQEWVAAGKFAMAYEQATLLRWAVGVEAPEATAPALDAAELVGAAFTALAADPELLARERARVRCILVDDAQHLDPQAAALVRLVGTGADVAAIAGDPDQAVFGFRGADSRFLLDVADETKRIVLGDNHRSGRRIGRLTAGLAAKLPGLPPHRGAVPVAGADDAVSIRVLPTAAKEAALVADTLRRAHLVDGVPWSQMAVIVRSVPLSIAPLRRALSAAGVPLGTAASELPLARQRGAAWLLLVLRAVARPTEFSGDDALALISGPVGGADPVSLRRLRRGLRRAELAAGGDRESIELLRQVLVGGGSDGSGTDDVTRQLTDVEAAPLRKVRTVLDRARKIIAGGRGAEEVLWAAWQASGLERRWAAASARGGPVGAQADRDLDAAVALFDAAANYVDRLPRSTVDGFIDYVEQQQIPVDAGARNAVRGEAVTILSAHSAAGREWAVVAVAGVQEGIWPSLRGRGSILGTDVLVELTAGIGEPGDRLSRTAPLLADERRLLLVACSRARRALLVTAVESASGDRDLVPSRFIDELVADLGADDAPPTTVAELPEGRVLALPALVAELRSVVCDSDVRDNDPERHARAASQLARLAAAGVKGAHPDQWYGLGRATTDKPLWDPEDGPVPMSPSTVELLRSCPLRWALERNGGSDSDNVRAVAGTLVHTLVQAVAGRVPDAQIHRALEDAWESIDLGSEWFSRQELERTRAMLETFSDWLQGSRVELTEAGVEVAVDCTLPPRADGDPEVRIRGRIDRLERDPDGRLVIVDVKTGKNPVTGKDAQQHAQLATYQVAAAAGGIDGEDAAEPGGGRLVYVAKKHNRDGATQRGQSALDAEGLAEWRETIHDAAAATRGPEYLAVVNDGCRHCPVSDSCPAQDNGRQVTDG